MLTDFSHLMDDDVKCGLLCLNLWTFESTNPVEAQGEFTHVVTVGPIRKQEISFLEQQGNWRHCYQTYLIFISN